MLNRHNHFQFAVIFMALLAGFASVWLLQAKTDAGASPTASLPEAVAAPECRQAVCVFFTDRKKEPAAGPDKALQTAIQSARASIDIAAYDLQLWGIRDALLAAHRRGVRVRLVSEADTAGNETILALEDAGIPISLDRPDGLMHNKFVLLDGAQLWTGSMNFTPNGAFKNDNNLLAFGSPEMVSAYQAEFEEMFDRRLFGAYSPTGSPLRVTVDSVPVEILFSPDDGVQEHLVGLIRGAEESIRFMVFSFTADQIGGALLERARAGVQVSGVFDESQVRSNQGTEYDRLAGAGLDVRLDGSPNKLHHKVLIIDSKIVVTGSYNFSASAEDRNDENLLVIHDERIAALFFEEFQRVYGEAR